MHKRDVQSQHQQPPWMGWSIALLVLGGAVISALLLGSTPGSLARSIEAVAAASASRLGDVAAVLPLGYAFGAGMVAAVNPCGFALLPTYLGLYLGTIDTSDTQQPWSRNFVQAVWVSATVTAGFVVLFGLAGLVLSVATTTVARYLPWLGLVVGMLLIAAGGRMLNGTTLATNVGDRLAGHLGSIVHQTNSRGYFAYGLAYGAASLSCTLPIFLTVVGSTLTVSGFGAGLFQFILYALGMGFVISLLTLSTALFKSALLVKVRNLGRYVEPVSALLLLFAGAYIVYYWLTQGELLTTIFMGS
jgi:cytochrome c-type biogenesis protein